MKLLAIIVPLAVLLLCAPRCSSQDGQDGVDEALIPSLPTEPLEDIPEESASDIRTPDGDAEVPTEDIAPDDAGDTLTVDSTEDADNTVTNDKTEAEDRKPLPAAVNKDAIPEPSWNRSALVWYRAGVDAYLDENWRECRRTLENALAEWHFFRRANIDCRLQCGDEARRAQPLFPEDVEHLHFAEEMVRATLCILKCKRRAFEGRATPHALPADQQQPFRDLKPYEYIQLCYYQLAEYQKAASAVYTILMHDPDNEIMRNNLKFYLGVPEVDETAIINYESEKYISLYLEGTEAYYLEDYDTAIRKLEASLKEFLKANEECRADCDGPFDQGWLPDFTSSVANHFVFCLKCKTKCRMQLSQLNGEKYEDFLPIHYNYLQFAYYKAGKLNKACAAAATYLLFFPADETMLENVNIYKALPKVNTDMFRPLEDAVNYLKRQTYEEALLRYISDEFVFDDTKKDTKPPQKDEEHRILARKLARISNRSLYNLQAEESLGGTQRFLVDGLAEKTECQNLIHLAKVGGVKGDGYHGKKSPHSMQENFVGVTLGRAALMVHFGLIDLSTLQLFLHLSERGRRMVSTYFNISKYALYFSYTHLVCRSAMPGFLTNTSYYSHEIHADNCWLKKNGYCVRSAPAYFWRDYSALLYLNDEFQGGEFVFSADQHGKHIQSSISPKCGRFVGFTSGLENLHGVRGVKSGSRCALALWFTMDPSRAEWGKSLTEEMVRYLESDKKPRKELVDSLQNLVKFNLKEARDQMLQLT